MNILESGITTSTKLYHQGILRSEAFTTRASAVVRPGVASPLFGFRRKSLTLHFVPPFGALGSTYAVHLRLVGKRVIDFLLVITELFFARCYG